MNDQQKLAQAVAEIGGRGYSPSCYEPSTGTHYEREPYPISENLPKLEKWLRKHDYWLTVLFSYGKCNAFWRKSNVPQIFGAAKAHTEEAARTPAALAAYAEEKEMDDDSE